jgi:hypothetical protein
MKRTFLSFVLMAGALAAQAVKAHAESMRFLQQAGANVIAQGDIDESTVAAFNAYKNAHPGVRRVVFDSMGGSVLEALALGRAIRQARLDTYVGGTYKAPGDGFTAANLESMGECYSACVYAFAGGMHRFFDATGGVMGIHQFEFVGNRTGDQTANEGTAQFLMTAIGVYLDEMGVSRHLLDWAALVPPNTIQPLPRAMAERFQLDNIGDRTAPSLPQANSATDRSDLDQTSEPKPQPPINADSEITSELWSEVQRWIASNRQGDLERYRTFYGDWLDRYYDRTNVPVDEVIRIVGKGLGYTAREITASNPSFRALGNQDIQVDYDKAYRFSGPNLRLNQGKVKATLRFRRTGTGWKITSEFDRETCWSTLMRDPFLQSPPGTCGTSSD